MSRRRIQVVDCHAVRSVDAALLDRRRRLAARLGDVEQVLTGSLTEQTRRCGRSDCHCAAGEPHGPYAYFAPPWPPSTTIRAPMTSSACATTTPRHSPIVGWAWGGYWQRAKDYQHFELP